MRSTSASKRSSSSAAGGASIARPHSSASAPVDQVAREQQPLGALGADAVRPQRGGRRRPTRGRAGSRCARRRRSPAGPSRAPCRCRRPRRSRAPCRPRACPQWNRLMKPRTLRLIIASRPSGPRARAGRGSAIVRLGALDEVVAAAEALAVAGQRDHVDGRVEVRALHALGQLARHRERDPVAALGPVERDPRDAPVDLVGERLHWRAIVGPRSAVPA